MTAPTTPQAMLAEFLDAFSRLDLDRMMNYFAPEATLFFPSEPHRLQGIDAIRHRFAGTVDRVRAEGRSRLNLDPRDQAVQLLGDVAVLTFHLPAPLRGRRTFVLQRAGDTWQIVHLHASNLPTSS